MRIGSSSWIALLVGATLWVSSPTLAAATASSPAASAATKEKAKKLYGEGQAAYQQGDFAAALALFQQAYDTFPAPALLFNIAQCHRKMNNAAAALETLEKYKAGDPNMPAKTKQDVDTQIEEARKIVEEEKRKQAEQEALAAKAKAKAEAEAAAAAKAKAEAEAAAAEKAKAEAEAEQGPDPIVIGAVAGGVVVAAVTGTVLAVVLLAPGPTPPTTSLGTVDLR